MDIGKRSFQLTPEQITEIQNMLKLAGDDPVYDRLRAVLYYATGYPLHEICAAFGCSRSTLMNWCRLYRECEPEGLVNRCMGGDNAHLTDDQLTGLTRRLRDLTPRQALGNGYGSDDGQAWTVLGLYRALRQWYGVVYRSKTSYFNLLRRYGPR